MSEVSQNETQSRKSRIPIGRWLFLTNEFNIVFRFLGYLGRSKSEKLEISFETLKTSVFLALPGEIQISSNFGYVRNVTQVRFDYLHVNIPDFSNFLITHTI
eukprot:TRINITY_DN14053_c0_g3_i1.p1 TRINITY_DN14053_c0_g3~~TRINITY_DN14053_c0_g3_i1.p1  ORF type:complete len:102 (-),score=8.53 TRINITY_DN14053_c0_g3_i1:571-876(-)